MLRVGCWGRMWIDDAREDGRIGVDWVGADMARAYIRLAWQCRGDAGFGGCAECSDYQSTAAAVGTLFAAYCG